MGAVQTGSGEHDVGWRFRRASCGHGLATEAALALIDCLFTSGATRVFAQTMAADRRSLAVMEPLGLRHVRTLHAHFDEPLPGTEPGKVEYEPELAKEAQRR